MAHHQHNELDRIRGAQPMQLLNTVSNMASLGDDEVPPDADEPPDEKQLGKRHTSHDNLPWPTPKAGFNKHTPRMERKHSLLTQGLTIKSLSAPVEQDQVATGSISLTRGLSTASNYSNASAATTADLTSDGHTSPDRANSPSPPLPPANFSTLGRKSGAEHVKILDRDGLLREAVPAANPPTIAKPKAEEGLERKRCIRFACGRTSADDKKEDKKVEAVAADTQAEEKSKRVSSLRFACPFRATNGGDATTKRVPLSQSPAPKARVSPPKTLIRAHRDSEATLTDIKTTAKEDTDSDRKSSDVQKLDIASSHSRSQSSADEHSESWRDDPVYHGKKLTLHDFLEKEDKFRRLGEEAEEEALQDEEDLDEEENEEDEDDEDDDEEEDESDQSGADDGNESDDEEGFAASDGESEAGSEYTFWTPARDLTTDSNDFIEPIRSTAPRTASISSIDSGHIPLRPVESAHSHKPRKGSRPQKIRPGTPELPDSTDFVCGTLDEDRPLEAAYLSCMEERRRSKHIIIPQDIDPSFPTSDPEDKDEDDNEDEDNEHLLLHGSLDKDDISSAHEAEAGRGRRGLHGRSSPKQSPLPLHRNQAHHSPVPPRKAQGQSPRRLRSPPPKRRLKSPPQPRKTSIETSPRRQAVGINYGSLSSRPNLTHTTSLPRSPAPIGRTEKSYAALLNQTSQAALATSGDTVIAPAHNRGAIDIVKGLEKKRQRRREKLAQKCHHRAAKEKARKPLPGKGAERMKEVGEQRAAKGRQNVIASKNPKYVLSI